MPTKVVSRQKWENTMAFGFRSNFASTSARAALLTATSTSLGQTWRKLCGLIARRRKDEVLDELDDTLLRDIGVIRERDIGVSHEATREAGMLFWPP
jgi:uncharacterized protein YjiS (DUF1127 family)